MTKLTVADVRAKFPQYEDLSDEQLLEGVRRKFYSDIPRETFFGNFGMQAAPAPAADRAPPRAPRAPVVDTTAPQAPATPEAAIAGLMAPPAAPAATAAPQRLAAPAMPVPSAPDAILPPVETGPSRLNEVAPPARPPALTLEAMPRPDTRFTPRATLAPADDPLIAAMTAPQPAPAATSSRDLTESRAPSDPFEGEGFGALAARRGQQFAQGATDVVAAVPESVAITGEMADRSRAAGAGATMDQRAQIIADIQATLQDPNLDAEDRAILERNLADLTEGQGVLQGMEAAPITPAQDRPVYQQGEKIRTAVEGVVGAPDPRDRGFWGQVATGAGNMTGMIAGSIAGSAVAGPVGGLAVGAGTGAAMNQSQVFEEALQSGADQETALEAAKWATLIGASEIIPINRALKILPPRLRGELTTGMMRKFVDIAQGAGEEAAQEYLAQVANNIVAQKLYDPDRGWTEGATDAALVGAVLGAGVGTAGVMLEGRGDAAPPVTAPPRPPAQPQTPEEELAAIMGAPAAQPAPAAPIVDERAQLIDQFAAFLRASDGAAIVDGSAAARELDRLIGRQKALGVTDEEIDAALAAPAQPAQPQAEAAPAAPQAPPEAEIAAAMGAQPAPAAPAQADPTEGGRFEILDEIENTPGGPVATGRKVRIDLETGQATVVGADGTPAQAGGAPGPANGAGTQPQAEDAPVGAGDVPPAADRAPEDDLAAAMGADAAPDVTPTYGIGTFERQAEGDRPTATIEVTREGPFDFKTRFPAPDPRLLDALEREGRNTFEGDPTPEQVASILDDAMADAEQTYAATQAWQAEAEQLAKVTKPSSQTPSGKNNSEAIKLEIAQKAVLRGQRDFDDTVATIADVWGMDAAQQFRDEAIRRAGGIAGEPIQWPNEGKKPAGAPPASAPESEIAAAMGAQPSDGFDVGARAARFPTTLEDVATPPQKGERGRQTHIYGEMDGQRYYLGSVTGNADAAAQEWAKTYPQARILTTDRADSTSINGEVPELDAAIAAKAGAPAAPEQELAAAMGAPAAPAQDPLQRDGYSARAEDTRPLVEAGGEFWQIALGAHGKLRRAYDTDGKTKLEFTLHDSQTGKAMPSNRPTFVVWAKDGKLYKDQGFGGRREWFEIKPVTKAVATAPFGASPAQAPAGIDFQSIRTDTARTPAGTEIEVEYAIVDLEALTASNLPDGRVNPAYPQERQPRDRTKDASERQIQRIMRDFDPRQLDAAPTTDTGAMIVDENGIVESGNGRTITLQRIFQERPDLARAYVAHLEAQGYPVEGIARPVLVRIRRTEMTPEEIEAYTRESNTDTKLAMSATEQAMADAAALPDAALDLYRGGDIDTAGNRDFVRAFIQAVVTENEQGKMIAPDGSMSQDAVRRVQAALLAKAYGDPALVAKLMESADNNIKSIGGALLDVSASWAKMRAAARAGSIAPEMDQTDALLEAVRLVDRARTERRNVIEFVKQPDLLSGEGISPMGQRFLALMFRDTRQWTKPAGRDNLAKWLGYYVEEAMKSAPGADLFGAQANPGGTLDLAKEKQDGDEKGSGGSQADLFAPRPAGSDGQGIRPADGGGARPGAQGATPQDGGQRPAGQPEGVEPFDGEKWDADRADRIKRSKELGNQHLDDLSRSVEGMRGVSFFNVHDPKERGEVRTVANTGDVVVNWADKYSADKNLVTEQTKDGKKMVWQSWLMPSDLKDYVVASSRTFGPLPELRTDGKATPKPTPILDELQRAIDARKALMRPGEDAVQLGYVDYMKNSSTSLWKRLSQAKTLADRHEAAVEWVKEMAAKENVEYFVAFDKAGAVIAAMRGTKNNITFPNYIERANQADGIGATVHNHPSNRGLSFQDIRSLLSGYRNLIVVGTNDGQFAKPAGRHLVNVGAAITKPLNAGQISDLHEAALHSLRASANMASLRMRTEVQKRLNLIADDAERSRATAEAQKELDAYVDALNFTFDHIITLSLARMGVLDYTGNAAEIVRAAGVNPDDFFDGIFTAVQSVSGRLGLQLTRGRPAGGDSTSGSAQGADGAAGGAGGTDRGTADVPGTGDGARRPGGKGEDLEGDDDADYTPPTEAEQTERDRKRAEAEAADRAKHPAKWKLIDAGYTRIFFSNDAEAESTSLRNLAAPSEPGRGESRALQFPFIWTKEKDGTEGLVARLAPLLDKANDRLWPNVAKMRRDLEALTGLTIKPRGPTLPGNLGREIAGYHHAVDLLSAGMVDRLLETRMLSTPEDAASAVSYAVHYTGEKPPKGQKRSGHITADQGALVLREFGIPEPTAAEIEDYLARYASIGRTEQGEAVNFNDYGKDVPLGMRAWAEIHMDRKGWHPFRSRFREPSAEFKAWLEANRPGDGPSTPSDSPPKTRAPKSGKPSSGNADLDAALDDIFGDDDAPGTGDDLERDSGDAGTQDDMGGTDVPPAAGGSEPGSGKRGGKGGGTGGKRGGRRSIPGGDAAPLGGAGNQGVDAGGGTKRRPAAGGNGGRRSGAGQGGLSPDAGRGGNSAGTAAGGARVTLTDAERAAAIRDILKENLERMIDRPGFAEGDGLDPRKYEALEALFIDGMRAAGADPAKMSDRDMFRAIATPLKNAGLDRETIVKMAPYLEAFTRNVKSGRVNLDPEPVPQPAPEDKAEIQRKADRIKPVMADEANIRATLPLLLPEQQDDVAKIERRFAKPDGHGMLITNGTGTGKTFTGGGQIKRFVQMGKGEILIIAPSEAVIAGWKRALEALGVEVNQLRDTRDAGRGVTITTYANLEQNEALATRSFDLVVADESQNLMSNKDGNPTGALNNLRALTHRPQDLWRKSRMLHADQWAKVKAMRDGEAKTQEYARLKKIEDAEVAAWSKEPRSKVLFLSATPFAYDKTVDYVEGYLFDYPKDGHVGNSRQDGRALFMIQNFGYRIRYHKLTKPESAVDSAVFEREFHEKLKREGVLSGRSLQIDVDYDRKFVTVADQIGTKIDAVLKTLWDGGRSKDKAVADGYETLRRAVMKNFNYLRRMQLLEAIKAKAAVEDIKAHLALGRKVVVFHDYNVGGGFNPFSGLAILDDANAIQALADLMQKHPDLNQLDFSSYGAPADTLKAAFGKQAAVFSGLIPQRQRLEGLTRFNTDDSGTDILIVQSDAGGAGISMHDLTGTHQRVLINLGMPTKPTTTLQEEGRILRVGTVTDAIFRYYTIGTAWEREAFAQRIAERSGTVENLALGNEARALRDAFIDAYVEAEPRTPSAEDGKGGKAKDGAAVKASPYEIAKTHYFGKMKVRGRRDQREGIDFYSTPEPLGFKMVEWAGARPNERVLEPSAGDGAIARYFPENVAITMVEPSNDLGTRALLRAPTATLASTTFEDYHIVNKHHVIVMNPPFGSGGATAMAHLAKAARHLRDGGRLIALIPTGPSADKRFDAWWESDDAKEFNLTADIALPAVAFERAGTNVMTRIVILDKISNKAEREAFGTQTKRLSFTGAKDISEFFDRLEMYDVPRRPDPKRDVLDELEAETQSAEAAPPSVKPGPALTTGLGGFKLGQTKHAKTGDDLFVATIANRVERDVYTALNALARSHGGWYSNFRGNGAIPGFQFKSEAARAAFLEDAAKPTVNNDPDAPGLAETAYHGTPYDFDRFSLQAIGTGEGAQAYGWGLYFAGKRSVSEWYRDKLSRVSLQIDGEEVPQFLLGSMSPQIIEQTEEYLSDKPAKKPADVSEEAWRSGAVLFPISLRTVVTNLRDKVFSSPSDDIQARLQMYRDISLTKYLAAEERGFMPDMAEQAAKIAAADWLAERASKTNPGRLYTVEIPDADQLLDFDVRLEFQPPAIQKILRSKIKRKVEAGQKRAFTAQTGDFENMTGAQIYDALADIAFSKANNFAGGLLKFRDKPRFYRDVSETLRGAGISGHRYLDGGSRNAGEGTHNYVVYDESAVNIIEKQQKAQMIAEANAAAPEILRLMPRLRAELDRLDLKRVKLYFDPLEPDWQGFFQVSADGDFEVVIGASLDPMKTLHHEVIHILRTMNLFTPEEWRALEIAAGKGWMEKHDIEARYPNLTHEERLEEAIAEEFSWALEKMRPPKGNLLVQAFNKIHRLLKAIRNVFRGAGFNTPEDIFGRILSGEISKRQAWNTGFYARMGYNLQAKAPRDTATGDLFAQPEEPKRSGMTADQRREMEARAQQSKMRKVGGNSGDAGPLFDDQTDLFGQRRMFQAAPAPTQAEVDTLAERIKADLGLRDLSMFLSRGDLKVNMIAVDRAEQGRGKGTEAMRRIAAFADARGLRITLSPGQRDDGFGTTSRSRLVEFYKRFGFKENKGRSKDFAISEGMYRDPARSSRMQARPLSARPLTPQARAHRNTAMGGPLFIPDRRVWEEITRAGLPIWQRLRGGAAAASDAVDRARQVIQDRFLPVLRAQEAIMRATGRSLTPEQNAYIAETTFSGKVGRHLLDIDEVYTKPIIKLIAETDGALTMEAVGEWLYARHAIERNAYIASINPTMPDGGSGMTDQDAQDILSDAAAGPHAARLQEIGRLIDGLRERTLKLREDAGLITNAEASMWRKQYKHYVPLKGFAETDHAEAVLDVTGIGKRYSIRGQETRRALGRSSEAFNPLQAALTQAQEVSIRAEKNRVGQALYELAKDFPSKALWEVKTPAQKRYFNRSTGLVETRVEDPVSLIMDPNEMAVKVGGKEVRILLKDERLARAVNTVGADQMSGIMRVMSMFSRFFSMTRTMLNPEFMITNAFRDFQTAQFNIQAFGEADKNRIAKAMAKNWRKAFLGVMRGQGYRFDTEWSRYFDEFQKAGAQVWFWTMEQPEAAKGDLQQRIKLARGGRARRVMTFMTTPSAIFNMRDNPALAFVEKTNLAVDNAIRLAAFVEARKAGWPIEQAAFLAKELTVNFNRRGEVGAQMNALYPFFNAAIQGSVRTVKALGSKRVAKMVAVAFAAGALNDLVNAALSEEDDDEELVYDKIPDYRNERNIHIGWFANSRNPIAIPMPYGYNVFPYAGQQLGKVIRGVKDPDEAMADVLAAAFGAFSPISAATPAQAISPVISDPIVEMAENKNWLGTPIYPQTYGNQTEPDAYVHFRGATEVSKMVAQALNSLTGGDFRQSGAIDVSPESLDHLATFVTGSAGAFWGRSADFLAKVSQGSFEEIEGRNVPFVRNVFSPVGEWVDRDRFYQFRAVVRDANADAKAYAAAGVPVPEDVAKLAGLYDKLLEVERELNGKGDWNPARADAKTPREANRVYLDFNREYLRIAGKQGQ